MRSSFFGLKQSKNRFIKNHLISYFPVHKSLSKGIKKQKQVFTGKNKFWKKVFIKYLFELVEVLHTPSITDNIGELHK